MDALEELGDADELSCREELRRMLINRYNAEAAPFIKEFEKTKEQLTKDWENLNERRIILSVETRSKVSKQHAQVRNLFNPAHNFRLELREISSPTGTQNPRHVAIKSS